MTPSAVILLITGIVAVIAIIIIISFIIINSNKVPRTPTPTPTQLIPEAVSESTPFTRLSPKSTCHTPLSIHNPPMTFIDHPVKKSSKIRAIKEITSTNHWLKDNKPFCLYPYTVYIQDTGLKLSWPNTPQDIMISTGTITSCHVVDIDALVSTITYQCSSGELTFPLVKGSPFITIEVNDSSVFLQCNFDISLESYKNNTIYVLRIDESIGYIIFLPLSVKCDIGYGAMIIPKMTGTIRLAYFNTTDMLDVLSTHYNTYAVESTISTKSTNIDGEWIINTSFIWTTKNMSNDSNNNLLMVALPHHELINEIYTSDYMKHDVFGPFRFVINNDNRWNLIDVVTDYNFDYPKISNNELLLVYTDEMKMISTNFPTLTIDWLKWLGSLATLLLIGHMLNQTISAELLILKDQLNLIREHKGIVSRHNVFVYDKTWGGIISNLGLDNEIGDSNDGNAYYEAHIGQYGYLIYAYAVAGYFDANFIKMNKETALYFVRNIANPCQSDNNFPMWRNKDWYLGYSLVSGLQEIQVNKHNIGENILGYYGSYLLSKVIKDDELMKWSLAMVGSEISSLQYYFQDDTDIVQMLKPLTLMSFDYVSNDYVLKGNVVVDSPEMMAYTECMRALKGGNEEIVKNIVKNHDIFLPYGSTWTSMLYWVLSV